MIGRCLKGPLLAGDQAPTVRTTLARAQSRSGPPVRASRANRHTHERSFVLPKDPVLAE
jgi:hypothetical protein